MPDLFLHKKRVASIFHLLGEHENDLTYSLAWALSQSPSFLRVFLKKAAGVTVASENAVIRLQQFEMQGGITDIEIEDPGRFFVIVEAKRGWTLPGRKQLGMYAQRPSFAKGTAATKRLLALSACSAEYALHNLEAREVEGMEIVPVSRKQMADLAAEAMRCRCSHAEKRLLRELLIYLREVMTMQDTESNCTYVVSLASGTPDGWTISWIDIVTKQARYFHPVGPGWPKEPPNYIAFRYHGRLQSIHHVESWDIFTNPHKKFSGIPDAEWGPHFLYMLGPAFGPKKTVKTGNIFRNGRVWCMLDTLFTSDTIAEARDISKERDKKDGQ